jgi:hypothetical protein
MRWKLVVLSSITATVCGVGLWSLLIIVFFGTARRFAYNDLIVFASMLIPIGMAVFAGIFVYRHTARRRKLQAILTALFSIVLMPLAYVAANTLLHGRLYIP